MSNKNNIEQIKELFTKENAILEETSEYIDRRAKTLNYTCKFGEYHTTSLADWSRGRRCACYNKYNRSKLNYNNAILLLEKYNATLLSNLEECETITTPLVFVNSSGEEQKISLNNLNLCDRFLEHREKISSLVAAGKKQFDIAEELNTTQHIISMCLRLWGSNNSNGNRFIEIDIPKEVLQQLYWDEEQHPKYIAAEYNCSIATVVKNMKKYTIPLRSKSEARQGKLNPIFDVGHTDTAKEKMSAAFLNGRKIGFNGYWGTISQYDSPSQGLITMRSSWEVNSAKYLTNLGYDWLYEHKTFKLSSSLAYRPDFYLPNEDLYIEVKGILKRKDRVKHRLFIALGYKLLVWDKEELLKRGIIVNSGDSTLNKKYRNIEPYNGLY